MLERAAEPRWPWHVLLERRIRRFPLAFYAGGVLALTALGTFGFLEQARALGVQGWSLVFLALLFLVGSSQMAVGLLNWLATFLITPHLLPRLDYSDGIAPESRTIVVVPTKLTSTGEAARLVETLEIHYLANRDRHLHFALLTDFRDATEENQPEDQALLQLRRRRRTAEPEIPVRSARHLFPVPPAPPLERRRKAAGWATNASGAS